MNKTATPENLEYRQMPLTKPACGHLPDSVEITGLEPAAYALRTHRYPSLAISPCKNYCNTMRIKIKQFFYLKKTNRNRGLWKICITSITLVKIRHLTVWTILPID